LETSARLNQVNLLLLVTILLSFYVYDFKKVFWLAFVLGLVNDLIFANLLGLSSLIFLGFCFLVFLYQKKFSSSHLLFPLAFIVLSDFIFGLVNQNLWSFKQLLILVGLSLIILFLLNRIKGKSSLELEIRD
jgi:cell shape-determining protein MreD